MTINGTQRSLGDSFTITATDPYSDEKAQDAVAGMITSASTVVSHGVMTTLLAHSLQL